MKLGSDTVRCAGRFGPGPDDPVCPRRQSCARYIALIDHVASIRDDGSDADGSWLGVTVCAGLCRDGQDYMIPVGT